MSLQKAAPDYRDYNNRRWKMLPLEDVCINTPYTFTLNLKTDCESLEEDYNNYKYYLSVFKPYAEYIAHFELSPIGKMHIHGQIIFPSMANVVRFYHKIGTIKQRFSIEISQITDVKEWDTYCFKQHLRMSEVIKTPLTHKDINSKMLAVKIKDLIEDSMFDSHLDD